MVKAPKIAKLFFWAFFKKCFQNYKLLFFHVYPLHMLEVYLGIKNWNFKKFAFLIKMV
jgi:hypothetical protein